MVNVFNKRIFSIVAVILWMGIIFYLSHQPATISSQLSAGIMEKIFKLIEKMTFHIEVNKEFFHFLIRKSAHFFAYFILGILVIHAVRRNNVYHLQGFLLAFLICIIYATTDEMHQLFIPGRSGEVKDVLIDSAGSITGIIIYLLITRLLRKESNT